MARSGTKSRGGGPKPTGKAHPGLELPEGYVMPKPAGKQKSRRKKRNNSVSQQELNADPNKDRVIHSSHQRKPGEAAKMPRPEKEPLFNEWKRNSVLTPEAARLIEALNGPVRYLEKGEPLCVCEPSIGFDKDRYDEDRLKKYEAEPLIPAREDILIPKKKEDNNPDMHHKLSNLPCSYVDEYPDGHTPAKNQKEAQEILKYFPHVILKTRAPLSGWGEGNLSFSSNADIDAPTTPLLRVLRNVELGQKILQYLAINYVDMASLSATCVTAFRLIDERLTDRWDMTRGNFNMCDYAVHEIEAKDGKGKLEDILKQRGVSPILIVSPTHDRLDPNRAYKWRRPLSARTEVINTMHFFRALFNVGDLIRNLQLHRMALLDPVLVKSMMHMLPNLVTLGVLQCPLISFQHSEAMLGIVQEYQEKYGPLKLDFSPRYHHGNPYVGRNGSFGLSYNDTGRPIKTAVAIRLIYSIFPLALKTGQHHWLEFGSSYCQFLDKLPLPDYFVVRVVNVALKAEKFKAELAVEHSVPYIKQMFNMTGAILGDGAFLQGNELEHECQLLAKGYPIWSEKKTCKRCKLALPDYLLWNGLICDSCALFPGLARQRDHYKAEKKALAASLYTECGRRLGEVDDIRDNFDFGRLAFLSPHRLENEFVGPAIQRADAIEHLRDVTTKVLAYIDRDEAHLCPPVSSNLRKAVADHDWRSPVNEATLDHSLNDVRWEHREWMRSENWDDMRERREIKLRRLEAYCRHWGYGVHPDTMRRVLRTIPCKEWFKDPKTGICLATDY